jgi:hypothetical protein
VRLKCRKRTKKRCHEQQEGEAWEAADAQSPVCWTPPEQRGYRNVRLSLLGVVATCELVRSSFAASRCTGIVLTRGALQPLREALTLLGEGDPEFSMA